MMVSFCFKFDSWLRTCGAGQGWISEIKKPDGKALGALSLSGWGAHRALCRFDR